MNRHFHYCSKTVMIRNRQGSAHTLTACLTSVLDGGGDVGEIVCDTAYPSISRSHRDVFIVHLTCV